MQKFCAAVAISLLMLAPARAESVRKPPYWASIAAGKAMMRSGPGKTYPAIWLYQRADLPIRVIEVYANWRRIRDPDGTMGWMLVNLLSDTRTALVTGNSPRPLHEQPDAFSPVAYYAAPGVVGRITKCKGEWCLFDVRGKRGFIKKAYFWGSMPGEAF